MHAAAVSHAVAGAVREVWDELALLASGTTGTLTRCAAPILGLTLIGWAANELSILLATEVVAIWPWLLIVVLALGAVVQLTTILVLLRMVAVRLGMPAMLDGASLPTSTTDARDTSLLHLLTLTLLPFLGMYAAFGFVTDYARRVVILSTVRKGMGELLGGLNPLQSTTALVVTVTVLVLGYVVKRLIDPWRERSRHPLAVGAFEIMFEACLLFLVLLGGFRITEQVSLWLQTREYHAWLDGATAWLGSLLHVDIPAVLLNTWGYVTGTLWPLLFSGLTRPFLWLAMAGLVFGTKVLTLADLWRLGEPVTEVTTRRERALAALRADTEMARGVRLIALKGKGYVLGGLDGKVIPAWQSLRLVLRAGWPFLAAYAIVFLAVDFGDDLLSWGFRRVLGGQPVEFWIKVTPFLTLASAVLVAAPTWVLLAVAYTRALSIFAERGETGVAPVLVPGQASVRQAFASGPVKALTALSLTVAMVVAVAALRPEATADVHTAPLLGSGRLFDQVVKVGTPRLAHAISYGSETVRTDLIFVVVPVLVSTPGPDARAVAATLVSGRRTYQPFQAGAMPVARAGFKVAADVVYEVDPADVNPEAVLTLSALEDVSGYADQVVVDLGLRAGDAGAAAATAAIDDPVQAAA